MKYFSSNIRHLRENKGLSQAQIVENVGFKRTTWNNYETGVSKPSVLDLIKIAKYFGRSESDLLHVDLSDTASLNDHGNDGHNASPNASPNASLTEEGKPLNDIPALRQQISDLEEENKRLKIANEALKQAIYEFGRGRSDSHGHVANGTTG